MGLSILKIRANDISFEAKLENLCGKADPREIEYNGEIKVLAMKDDGSPVIVRTDAQGNELTFARVDKNTGSIIRDSANVYLTEDEKIVDNEQIQHSYLTVEGELIPAIKNVKSDELLISQFVPLSVMTDDYLIEKYYQITPYQGKSKSDLARKTARESNIAQMKNLWDYLHDRNSVGKGMVSLHSAGWLPNLAFVRAIQKEYWTLEIALAKQRKQYTWKEEHSFKVTKTKQATAKEF